MKNEDMHLRTLECFGSPKISPAPSALGALNLFCRRGVHQIKEHDNICPFEMLPIDDSVTKSRVAIAKGETDKDAVKKPAGKGPHYGRVHANDTINVLLAALLYGKKGKEGDL